MAKVPKVKKREVSVHSRAARRGASPSGSSNVKSTAAEVDYNPWMHGAQSAGITKKKKTKQLTRQQKARHAKGLERGDQIANKLEKKVADSKARGKKVQARRVDWEDLSVEMAVHHVPKDGKDKTAVKAATEDTKEPRLMDGLDANAPTAVEHTPAEDNAQVAPPPPEEEDDFEVT